MLGADDEPRLYLEECTKWVLGGPWVDPRDGFDYGKGMQATVASYVRVVAVWLCWITQAMKSSRVWLPRDGSRWTRCNAVAHVLFPTIERPPLNQIASNATQCDDR